MRKVFLVAVVGVGMALALYAAVQAQGRESISALPLTVRTPADNPTTPEKIVLGRLLFWDPALSGNKDVACATCHHPEAGYAENLDLSIGVHGVGLGPNRSFAAGSRIPFVKRNSQ